MFGNSQFQTCLADFVLKEASQGFDDFLEIYIVWQTTHIMVGFDHSRFSTQAAFHHVRIDGSLHQEIHGANLFGFFLEYTDEFLADDLAFLFRFRDAGQSLVEAFLCIYPDKVQFIVARRAEHCFHLVSFVFAEQAMIHEHTGQLFPHGLGEQDCCHRRIHTT